MKRSQVYQVEAKFNRGPDADTELVRRYTQIHRHGVDLAAELNVEAARFRFNANRPA